MARPSTKQLGIRVPARMGERLDALAKGEHNSVPAVVRRLLTSALKHEPERRDDHGNEAA